MGNSDSNDEEKARAAAASGQKLRGTGLKGSEQRSAVDHTAYEERRNPDTELHLDNEKDDLYDDGLDVDEDNYGETLSGTRGGPS